jgi:hypothetical protein
VTPGACTHGRALFDLLMQDLVAALVATAADAKPDRYGEVGINLVTQVAFHVDAVVLIPATNLTLRRTPMAVLAAVTSSLAEPLI